MKFMYDAVRKSAPGGNIRRIGENMVSEVADEWRFKVQQVSGAGTELFYSFNKLRPKRDF